ncbi:MAG TPA: response regulator transcription factor [Terriglobales bacterium]|jgi:two-component system response regulator NreC|nr:response regulator transcription factor [Terriglobales bacterium]
MRKIRILVVDDHGIVRRGISLQLMQVDHFQLVGEASDGREAVGAAETLKPDVVIMDITMPNLNGIDAAAQILKRAPHVGVILLSMHSDESYLARSLAAGAKGYLAKDTADVDIVRAVETVAQGKPYFSAAISRYLVEDYVRQMQQRGLTDSYDLLTEREKETLQLLAEGKSNKEVAHILKVGVSTAETHRANIMTKLGLHSTAEIVLYAVRKKIISTS